MNNEGPVVQLVGQRSLKPLVRVQIPPGPQKRRSRVIAKALTEIDDATLAELGVSLQCSAAARQAAKSGTHSRVLEELALHIEETVRSAHNAHTWMRAKARTRILSDAVVSELAWERTLVNALVDAGVQPGAIVQPIQGGVVVGTVRVIVRP